MEILIALFTIVLLIHVGIWFIDAMDRFGRDVTRGINWIYHKLGGK